MGGLEDCMAGRLSLQGIVDFSFYGCFAPLLQSVTNPFAVLFPAEHARNWLRRVILPLQSRSRVPELAAASPRFRGN